MADHTMDMLRSAIRAMNEVVLPAVDRQHPLALEQATLVTRILQLLEQRLAHWPARLRWDLVRQIDLARALENDARSVSPTLADALRDAAGRGVALLADDEAQPPAWQAGARELGGLAALVVEAAQGADEACRRRVESTVVAAAAPALALQRAWFLPQGWEPDPTAVPSLEAALRPGPPK